MKMISDVLIHEISSGRPVLWENPNLELEPVKGFEKHGFHLQDIYDAETRLLRFAPLIARLFPETIDGIIESPLVEIEATKAALEQKYNTKISGRIFLKCDSHLKVAGSIKARGGIYEVLKHAEQLAFKQELLKQEDDYSVMAEHRFKEYFSNFTIGVGSTGNLGLSIGIMSAALGFHVDVHMSRDAKEWKKKLLREKGATVIEYQDDYSKAVEEGRKQCEQNPNAYFIDDENSRDLFLGYSVAALRLKAQLQKADVVIDDEHPLIVYLPCGVGGAPGGITFGLKMLFREHVHCCFAEPTHAPCMLLGLATGNSGLHVSEYGLDNITEADGLAVGSPSTLVCETVGSSIEAIYTIEDEELFYLLAMLKNHDGIKVESSAASALLGPVNFGTKFKEQKPIHICWATGGLFLPEQIYAELYERGGGSKV